MIGFLRTLFSSGPPFDDSELAAGYDSIPAGSASVAVVALRRPGPQITLAIVAGLPALVCVGATLSKYVPWWGRVLTGLACVALAILIWRIAVLAVYAAPRDLVIVNLRNTHRVPWSQIEDIYATPVTGMNDTSVLVRLKEGAVISLTLYSSLMFFTYSSQRDQAVEQLSQLRTERTGTGA